MAGVIGSSGGGYATVNPTQGNPMGEALQNVENSAFKYNSIRREEQQAKLQAERELQENRRRDFSEAQKFSKENPFIATGTGLDAVNRQSYMNAKEAANKAYTEYMKTGDDKHKAVYENAIASVSNLSNIPTQINELKESWVKNAADYNPDSLKKKAAILDQISSGQIVQTNDANGNPRYTVFEKDENGNISKIVKKEISGEQLIQSLQPVKSFNIDEKDGFIDLFNRNIGKERKVTVGTGLNAVEKIYNPGAEDLAKIMAQEAVSDRDKMYETLRRMNLDPEDERNYTDPKVKEAAAKKLEEMLMVTAPTTISKKPDTSIEMLQLARTKEANDERQRRTDNAFRNQDFDLKELDRELVTVGTTKYKLTSTGIAAKKAFYDNPKNKDKKMTGEDWPPESFIVIRSSVKVDPNKGKKNTEVKHKGTTAKKETAAELKAKAEALRKKYAPKK